MLEGAAAKDQVSVEINRELLWKSVRPGLYQLVITQTFARNVRFGFQPANAGGSIKPRVERDKRETLGGLA